MSLTGLYVCIALATTYPNFIAVISNVAGSSFQGEVIGMIWSVSAVMIVASTFVGSFLVALHYVFHFILFLRLS